MRYAGGIGLAAALCGITTMPIVLYCMQLNSAERRQMISIGVLAAVLLPASLYSLYVARRFSVPPTLLDMTSRGWECIAVVEIKSDAGFGPPSDFD
jgi:hypothetical protein